MSAPKLTPWFPGHIKPVRPGVYETDSRTIEERCFQRWNGRHWCTACDTPEKAGLEFWGRHQSLYQDDKWRGLAEPPK